MADCVSGKMEKTYHILSETIRYSVKVISQYPPTHHSFTTLNYWFLSGKYYHIVSGRSPKKVGLLHSTYLCITSAHLPYSLITNLLVRSFTIFILHLLFFSWNLSNEENSKVFLEENELLPKP